MSSTKLQEKDVADKTCNCQEYKRVLKENIQDEDYTLADFGRVCEELKLPFFEVKETINPFAEPHNSFRKVMYESYNEFRKSMPDWSARNYDYENDRVADYYAIKGILDGSFEVHASNASSSYRWEFAVTDLGVLVRTTYCIED